MKLKPAIFVVLALSLIQGLTATPVESQASKLLDLALLIATVVVGYLWYREDARERRYRGSALMGGGVILLSIVAVPIYLYRSRPEGARLKAILLFFGLVILSVVVTALAALVALSFAAP